MRAFPPEMVGLEALQHLRQLVCICPGSVSLHGTPMPALGGNAVFSVFPIIQRNIDVDTYPDLTMTVGHIDQIQIAIRTESIREEEVNTPSPSWNLLSGSMACYKYKILITLTLRLQRIWSALAVFAKPQVAWLVAATSPTRATTMTKRGELMISRREKPW